ncbi:hypothetical protein BN132_1857 [Cronobacter turicensis 564]|nr:hypothetical protein BN132_1857 [Cronobacter turicensis 564]
MPALSAFCFTVAVICSILAAVCSSDVAVDSVRCARSTLPAASSRLPVSICALASRTRITDCASDRRIASIALTRRPSSLLLVAVSERVRSPAATCSSCSTDCANGLSNKCRNANQTSVITAAVNNATRPISASITCFCVSTPSSGGGGGGGVGTPYPPYETRLIL